MKSRSKAHIKNLLPFLSNLSWEAIHNRTNHWISDFEFAQFEIAFLQQLLAKVSVWSKTDDNKPSVDDLARKLGNLELRRDLFARVIKYHRIQVEEVIENKFADGQTIKEDHGDLEKRIIEFMTDFRAKKFAVYSLIKDNIDPEKLPHLLDRSERMHMIEYE